MAVDLPFIDSFSHYTNADLALKWDVRSPFANGVGGAPFPLPFGTGQVYIFNGLGSLGQIITTPGGTLHFGAYVLYRNAPVVTIGEFFGNVIYIARQESSGFEAQLRYTHDGRLKVTIPNASLEFKSDMNVHVRPKVYYRIEWKIIINQSPDWPTQPHLFSSEVWIDDELVLTLDSVAFVGNTASVTPDRMYLGSVQVAGSEMFYSDVYLATGRFRNTRVIPLRPTADGSTQQWNPAPPHWSLLDETLMDLDDWIETAILGHLDLIQHEDAPGNINGVPSVAQPVFFGTWGSDNVYNVLGGASVAGISGRFSFFPRQTGLTTDGVEQGVRRDA